jgi:hypothetical protein
MSTGTGTAAEPQPAPAPVPWYSRSGNFAQIASAVIAAIGFAGLIYEFNENQKKSAQDSYRAELADARRNYASYSDAILRYPYLSVPDYDFLMRNHNEWLRYQNFVAHMLYAYDDILNVVEYSEEKDAKKEWLLAFAIDIEPHRRYLCQVKDHRIFGMYRRSIQDLLEKTVSTCTDQERVELKELLQAKPAQIYQ